MEDRNTLNLWKVLDSIVIAGKNLQKCMTQDGELLQLCVNYVLFLLTILIFKFITVTRCEYVPCL